MKTEILIGNIIQMFFMGLVLSASISAIFSITAVKEINRKRAVDTTRDVFTFLGAFFLCYFLPKIRIFTGTGVKLSPVYDLIITSLVLAKFADFITDLFDRVKRGD
ncbi:MAG: hypothetical protein JW982_05850 [Spirochaetes bacterium]|nr:hypothetical protein [Spirochaetota bacterium]